MSVNSSLGSVLHCSDYMAGTLISTALILTKTVLLLPLYSLVLYLGQQRWRQQRSFATTSHSDIFTYHMFAIELISLVGSVFFFVAVFTGLYKMMHLGLYVSSLVFPGHVLFHALTCVERYLAVVHPVTYLGLRQSGGVKIRNISTACVWLLCLGWTGVTALYNPHFPHVPLLCLLTCSSVVVSFCSLRVLCVLIRPRPGEVGGDRERIDQSKKRAFHTIMAIMGVLWLWFAGIIVCLALNKSALLSYSNNCLVLISAYWFTLPCSLVSPLLFLHRAGKLSCCR